MAASPRQTRTRTTWDDRVLPRRGTRGMGPCHREWFLNGQRAPSSRPLPSHLLSPSRGVMDGQQRGLVCYHWPRGTQPRPQIRPWLQESSHPSRKPSRWVPPCGPVTRGPAGVSWWCLLEEASVRVARYHAPGCAITSLKLSVCSSTGHDSTGHRFVSPHPFHRLPRLLHHGEGLAPPRESLRVVNQPVPLCWPRPGQRQIGPQAEGRWAMSDVPGDVVASCLLLQPGLNLFGPPRSLPRETRA